MLIEGGGFGKQPTVSLGGRPAEIHWRTDGGGLIVQVPSGVAAGAQPLVVEVGGKRAETTVHVQRLAVVLDGPRGLCIRSKSVAAAENPRRSKAMAKRCRLRMHATALSADGAAAYVLWQDRDRDEVAIVDLTAAKGPFLRDHRRLSHRAQTIVAASAAKVVAIIGENQITVWNVSEANRPSPWPAAKLPEEARGATLFALDRQGHSCRRDFPNRTKSRCTTSGQRGPTLCPKKWRGRRCYRWLGSRCSTICAFLPMADAVDAKRRSIRRQSPAADPTCGAVFGRKRAGPNQAVAVCRQADRSKDAGGTARADGGTQPTDRQRSDHPGGARAIAGAVFDGSAWRRAKAQPDRCFASLKAAPSKPC